MTYSNSAHKLDLELTAREFVASYEAHSLALETSSLA